MPSFRRIRRAGFHYFIFFIISFFTETMTKKEITINGKQYPVCFDMQAMMNFEEISGQSFFEADLLMMKNRLALVIAAVLAADKDSDLKTEDLVGGKDIEAVCTVNAAYTVVAELMGTFFKVPDVEKQNTQEAEQQQAAQQADGKKPKN